MSVSPNGFSGVKQHSLSLYISLTSLHVIPFSSKTSTPQESPPIIDNKLSGSNEAAAASIMPVPSTVYVLQSTKFSHNIPAIWAMASSSAVLTKSGSQVPYPSGTVQLVICANVATVLH